MKKKAWHESVKDCSLAALETIQDIYKDMTDRPLFYGSQAAECIPGGTGLAATLGNQGYNVIRSLRKPKILVSGQERS